MLTLIKMLWIASFDIGKKNFSFYIEEFDPDDTSNIIPVQRHIRFNPNGTPSTEHNDIMNNLYKQGSKILLENVDLTLGCDPKAYLDPLIYYNMIDLLDEYSNYWDKCDIFVIEKQMSFGQKHNTMALKLGQHCWSYFALRYGRNKEIVEFPAYHKTQILGAPKLEKLTKTGKVTYKAVDKPTRKKWCITKAEDIISSRGDMDTLEILRKARKKDDLSDVICQLQAFKYCKFIDKFIQ